MVADIHSREQRLRKQAELQSLYGNLASLREREASYMQASAAIPEMLVNQINDLRRQIEEVERELLALDDETVQSSGRQFYRDAFAAESAGEMDKALKLYKSAARGAHPDAGAAIRSIRYARKTAKSKPASGPAWSAGPGSKPGNQLLLGGLAGIIVLAVIILIARNSTLPAPPEQAKTVTPASTATPTPPEVILIIPKTATPEPTSTPTATPTPQPTNPPPATEEPATPTATPTATLRPPPIVLEPKNGLVWEDGAIVFEFKDMDLAYDELYCLNTLRGYDRTNTENWSYTPAGSKKPAIPIEAQVFRLARLQGMQCIVWSAAIGKGSCNNIISQSSEERIIGLPRPCEFK